MAIAKNILIKRHVELITERAVERFLERLFIRNAPLRCLYIVSPFIAAMQENRFSLADLRTKIEYSQIPTYLITRTPVEDYHSTAMEVLLNSPWIEIRYNQFIHAKVYIAIAKKESESFALFGSGNLTGRARAANIEVAMLVSSEGPGKEILRQLEYWVSVSLRTLKASKLIQPIKVRGN
ncbi:hypothetical protein [Desulfobacca acetoxidans]|uniref:Phospholipase D-like domain-containing protein n=1 Tax=Desulfobacca acetoxidans (strain ATCC 700848 / DSM 11109 / ASRB2) TaxID=880072 RepID=F2NGZ7_DESAR|nr:hypothetical protein [Desulfobacca acetoxidans]AEB08768.1 hypothetical protein Desac_0894 [Desulfobacca acetoxidans DSM 11109]